MASKNTKKAQVQATKNFAALNKAASLDISKSLGSLSTAGVEIQGTLSKISENLIQKHGELQAVDETIKLKQAELQNLHGVDAALLTLDEAKAQHTQFLDEAAKEKSAIEQSFIDLRKTKEVEQQREEANFKYNLQQSRQVEADQWADMIRSRNHAERDRKEAFDKDIASRELLLKAKEVDYQAALAKAATFDAEVEKAAKTREAIVTNSLTRDFKHQQEINAIQHSTAVEKLKHDNERLIQAANNYETQVKELQVQLKEAYAKNAELASKAVDGASSTKAQADALSLMSNLGGANGSRTRA